MTNIDDIKKLVEDEVSNGRMVEVPMILLVLTQDYIERANSYLWWLRVWVPALAVACLAAGLLLGRILWGPP